MVSNLVKDITRVRVLVLAPTHLKPHSLQNHPPESARLHLLAEDTAHRRPQPNAQRQLIQAQEAFVRIHDAVIVHHGHHKSAGERVPVEQSDRRHGIC
jgi:hypothetical protein